MRMVREISRLDQLFDAKSSFWGGDSVETMYTDDRKKDD